MMNRRTRPVKPNRFRKFLKPGALAKIRDSHITARRRLNSPSNLPLQPSSSLSNDALTQQNDSDGFPCFVSRIFAPLCPQRKKLMVSKSVFFLTASPVRSTSDSPDTVLVESLSNDFVVAN